MVFLVTDGKSNIKKHLTIPRAQALKRSGVKIFVVAVGGHVRGIDEMVNVASYPPQKFLFRVKKLDGFSQIIKLMVQRYSPRKYAITKRPVCTSLFKGRMQYKNKKNSVPRHISLIFVLHCNT